MTKKQLVIALLTTFTMGVWSQEIVFQQDWAQIPVLKFKPHSPVLQFKIKASNNTDFIKSVVLDFKGTTDINDIASVELFDMGKDSLWSSKKGKLVAEQALSKRKAVLNLSETLSQSFSYFLVAVKVKNSAPLHHRISVGVDKIGFAKAKPIKSSPNNKHLSQRIGIALRKEGDDGVSGYRIPGLASTNTGTLLAIYDVRRDSRRDLQGNIDIGVSRSTDGGNTWEPMQMGLDMGEYGGLPQKYNGVSDASILIDKNSDDIYLAGCWMHGVINRETGEVVSGLTEDSTNWNHQWRNYGSLPGFDIDKTSQFLISKSTDDGKTWGEPINITKQIKRPEWHLFAPAPGSGITLKDGTLVLPTQGKNEEQVPFSNITYSKDSGKTWQSSNPSFINTTENMVVQLSDGSLMQNMRDNRNAKNKTDTNGRAIFVTEDMGQTWIEHPTHHGALKEPRCMASLYKHTYMDKQGRQKSVLLFSNPNSKYHRESMTIKVSFDDGKTWPKKNWLLLDDLGLMGGYSSLTSINNNTIGILYEGSQAQMTFESIDLEELGVFPPK